MVVVLSVVTRGSTTVGHGSRSRQSDEAQDGEVEDEEAVHLVGSVVCVVVGSLSCLDVGLGWLLACAVQAEGRRRDVRCTFVLPLWKLSGQGAYHVLALLTKHQC